MFDFHFYSVKTKRGEKKKERKKRLKTKDGLVKKTIVSFLVVGLLKV